MTPTERGGLRVKNFQKNRYLTSLFLFSVFFTGCYTQLVTRSPYAPNGYGPQAVTSDSLVSRVTDSLSGTPTIIINNYDDPYLRYRGYAHWQWDYPLLGLGFYSSYQDRYYRPYWWTEGRYRGWGTPGYARPYPRNGHRHPSGSDRPPAPSGPYQSDVRLFNPKPSYPPVEKGRRAVEPVNHGEEANPAPKESASGDKSPSVQSESSETKPQPNENYPERPRKGRRR